MQMAKVQETLLPLVIWWAMGPNTDLGKQVAPKRIIPVKDETATPRPVQGLLYTDLTVDELEILDWFEDVEYTRSVVQVKDDETNELCDTQVYVWTNPLEELDLTQDWDYDQFRTQHLSNYLVNTVAPCRIEFERMKKESS